MHYRVYSGSELIYDSTFPEKEWKIINTSLEIAANEQGSFTFTVPSYHVKYNNGSVVKNDIFKKRGSIITINVVDSNGIESWFWEGEIIDDGFDYHNFRSISCEGALGYLNSIKSTPRNYAINTKLDAQDADAANKAIKNCLNSILTFYNKILHVTEYGLSNHEVYIGSVSGFDATDIGLIYENDAEVVNSNGYFYFSSAFESFWTIIENHLVQKIGGFLNMRRDEDGKLRLDYSKLPYSFPGTNEHLVNYFTNLIDVNKNETTEDMFTVLIPRGRNIDKNDPYYIPTLGEGVTQRLLYGYYGVLKRSKYYYAHKDNASNQYYVPANDKESAPDTSSSKYQSFPNGTAFRCRQKKDNVYYYAYYIKIDNQSYSELTSFMDKYDYSDMSLKCRFTLKRLFNAKPSFFIPSDEILFEEFYNTFGYIEKVVDFDNAQTETQLVQKAYNYLYDKVVKTWWERFKGSKNLDTVDLTFSIVELDNEIPIRLYDKVIATSEPHGLMDVVRGVTSLSITLDSPEKSQVTLSTEKKDNDMTSI